jgi:uncharacterized protein YecT (DUF1311 family)
LANEQGTYQLTPDQGMLAWCDADIDDKDKSRVLNTCKLGDHCEIKGIIRGHGAFAWVEITSVIGLADASAAVPSELDELKTCSDWGVPSGIAECLIATEKRDGIILEQEYRDALRRSADPASLRATERRWLKYQERTCATAKSQALREGPGNAELSYARCALRTTIQRIEELRAWR